MRLSVLLAILPAVFAAPSVRAEPASIKRRENGIPGKYIVRLRDEVSMASVESARSILKTEPERTYKNVFHGFAGQMDEEELEALSNHPDVLYIEQDGISRIAGWFDPDPGETQTPNTLNPLIIRNTNSKYVTQTGTTWGIARISRRAKGNKDYNYTYDDSGGEGVCNYVIDTGIDDTHKDFEGRAKQVKTWIKGEENKDFHGHGTHVAGTIGSLTFGVAKKSLLLGLKGLDRQGRGPDSGIIESIDWIPGDVKERGCANGVTVNLSLTADTVLQSMNDACAKLVKQGMHVAVAAGNMNRDASQDSPASEPSVCTVAGSAEGDGRFGVSNHGKLVDINAPAMQVVSTMPGGGNDKMSGTSMASPHVAGLAAYLMVLEKVNGGKACDRIVELATKDALEKLPAGTPNLLAFNGNPSG